MKERKKNTKRERDRKKTVNMASDLQVMAAIITGEIRTYYKNTRAGEHRRSFRLPPVGGGVHTQKGIFVHEQLREGRVP